MRSALEETVGVALSLTVNVNLLFGKGAFGVPLMDPVPESNLSPSGNGGATDHVSGGVKPVDCKVVDG